MELLRDGALINGLPLFPHFLFELLNAITFHVACADQYALQSTQTKVVVGLTGELFVAQFKEGNDLGGQLLCSAEALGVEHDLRGKKKVHRY